jgi:probable addiction module antidote protein
MKKGRVAAAVRLDGYFRERLRDPETAAAYLDEAAAQNDASIFLQALREVAEAQGGVGRIARKTGLNRQQLYTTLSAAGNPEFRSLTAILASAGFRLGIARLGKRPNRRPARKNAAARRAAPSASPRV